MNKKIENLLLLKNKLTLSCVPESIYISLKDWGKNKDKFISVITGTIEKPYIVRSCSEHEDGEQSFAGHFKSILSVKEDELSDKIDDVIQMAGGVIIQHFYNQCEKFGVVFTADLTSGAPYYTISMSSNPEQVTSGIGSTETKVCYGQGQSITTKNPCVVSKAAAEIKKILGFEVDVEFGIYNETIIIFQARQLRCPKYIGDLESDLIKTYSEIKSIYSVMSDWNPAEIIGIRPNSLALNLYKKLITDSAWSVRRHDFGYRQVAKPLLIDFCGMPYIDVVNSLESFIPKNLNEHLSKKILDYYINKLKQNPSLHDKLEFDIALTCYSFDENKYNLPFDQHEIKEIKKSLLDLTDQLILNRELEKDADSLRQLSSVDNIIKFGTIPFAGIARCSFIAKELMNGMMTKDDQQKMIQSLNTVSANISSDAWSMNKTEFLKKYGHLRPRTYDKDSRTYNEAYDDYFHMTHPPKAKISFSWNRSLMKIMLKEHGFKSNSLQVCSFIENSIRLREFAKFKFTKFVNMIIESCPSGQPVITAMNLPFLITQPSDVYCFTYDDKPNYITQNKSVGPISEDHVNITGKIVFIENADPGYDWMFCHNIAGMVTKYGGINSHMAIRCEEHNVPAVIGCGHFYEIWKHWKIIELNCKQQQVVKII